VVVTARSPFHRLRTFAQERDLKSLTFLADESGDFTRDYVSVTDADTAGLSVFSRRTGEQRHFWSMEMSEAMADPGQDQRGAPDADLLWTILDLTPDGRGKDRYPRLQYQDANRVVTKYICSPVSISCYFSPQCRLDWLRSTWKRAPWL
jgi:predicted dithiol-disulfide oxidoreductase (DUF899 family)